MPRNLPRLFDGLLLAAAVAFGVAAQEGPPPPAPPAEAPATPPSTAQPDDPHGLRSEDWTVEENRWYVIEVMGHRAGWRHETRLRDESRGLWQTRQEQVLTLRRGDQHVTVRAHTAFVENERYEPIYIETSQQFGRTPVVRSWAFLGRKVKESERQGDRERTRLIDPPTAPILTPRGEDRLLAERVPANAERIEYDILGYDVRLPIVRVTWVKQGTDTHEIDGRTVPTTVWRVTQTGPATLERTVHLSSDLRTVYASEEVATATASWRLAPKEEATAPLGRPGRGAGGGERPPHGSGGDAGEPTDARGEGPPEVMTVLFVRPSRPIPDVLDVARLRLRLKSEGGDLVGLPVAGAQRVFPEASQGEAAGSTIVLIEPDNPLPATEGEASDERFLAGSAMMDTSDEALVAFARRAVAGVSNDPAARAEALRRAVRRHVSGKGLGSAFATASETLRTRAGDCTEHAVLLAALLRTQGIPSRVAVGMVYADAFAGSRDIFAWHMWTQALVDGRWVDLDPTLDAPFHAGHVLAAMSALEGGSFAAELAKAMRLMEGLTIEVLEIESRP